ncbi:MAG: sugar ABC transporter substrate-binding protein [Anaerolineales bacterium]|nr:sugar ABC transporter substrate-binding protein [Anaerolineales bacterium]
MKKNKILQLVTALLMLSLVLSACGGQEPEAEDTIQIGFSVIDISMGYWTEQIEGAQAKADELGVELLVHNSDTDPAKEISAMENWIAQGVDAIIVSAVDAKALETYVAQAHEKGIFVVGAIHDLEGADAFVDQDEYRLGYMTGELAGQWITDNLEPDAEFAVLGFDGLEHVIIRGDGMEDGVLANAPEAVQVARQDCNGSTDLGMEVAESLLQAYPDLRVFVAVNDACALGIYEAIRATGKELDDFCVVGSDGSQEAFEKIREEGIFRGTIDLNPYGAGQMEVQMAYDLIMGNDVEASVLAPMQTITSENVPE